MTHKPTVFISYSGSRDFLGVLQSQLFSSFETIVSEWKDQSGVELKSKVQTDIENADIILVIWTKASKNSAWVNQEIGYAFARKKLILPVVEKGLELPAFLSGLEYEPLNPHKLDVTAARTTLRLTALSQLPQTIIFNTYQEYGDWWLTINESRYVKDFAYWQTPHDIWSATMIPDVQKSKITYKILIRGNTEFDRQTVSLYKDWDDIAICGATELSLNDEVYILGDLVIEAHWDPDFRSRITTFLEKEYTGDLDHFIKWYYKVSQQKTRIYIGISFNAELASSYKILFENLIKKYNKTNFKTVKNRQGK